MKNIWCKLCFLFIQTELLGKMKKFAKFLLLAIVWLTFLWLSYAQEWSEPYIREIVPRKLCPCSLQQIGDFASYSLILILFLSLLIMPSWWIFKKAWLKPRKSLVPIWNIYTLFGITSSKFWQLLYLFIIILFVWIFIYGEFIYPASSYSSCCEWERIIWMNLWIFALFLCIFIVQLYCLARKFGLKVFYSICLALFFPIWVRILSFGSYEYIGNKENENNLESK